MKIFEKTAALLLAFLLCAPLAASVPARAEEEAAPFADAIHVMRSLKIMANGPDGTFMPEAAISRGELAAALVKAAGLDGDRSSLESIMSAYADFYLFEHLAYQVDTAVRSGLMQSYRDGTFRPGGTVTYGEVLKAAVSLLGYEPYIAGRGLGEAGYLQIAGELKLTAGFEANPLRSAKRGHIAQILYRALEADVLQTAAYGQSNRHEVRRGETLLKRAMGLDIVKGQVSANQYTALDKPAGAAKNSVVINETVFGCGDTDAAKQLGFQVKAYYLAEENNRIACVLRTTKEADILTVPAERIRSYANNLLTYQNDSGRLQTARVEVNADIIFNQKAFPACPDELFVPAAGELLLIGAANGYTVVFITSYTLCVVHKADEEREIIYDKFSPASHILLDRPGTEYYLEEGASRLPLSALREWDVLFAAKSYDGDLVAVTRRNRKLTGALTHAEVEGDAVRSVTVDGTDYRISPLFPASQAVHLRPGAAGSFYLDGYQNVVLFREGDGASAQRTAYLADTRPADGLDDSLRLKLLTQEGKLEVLFCAKRILLDQESVETKERAGEISAAVGSVIGYRLNAEGKIAMLDTAYTDTPKSAADAQGLRLDFKSAAPLNFRSASMTFDGKINVNAETVIFMIPEDRDERLFGVASAGSLIHGNTYTVESYCAGPEIGMAKAVVMVFKLGSFQENVSNITVVSAVTDCLDGDGMNTQRLTGYAGNVQVSVMSLNEAVFQGIRPGDVVRWQEVNGRAARVEVIFSEGDRELKLYGGRVYSHTMVVSYAGVYSIKDGIYQLTEKAMSPALARGDLTSYMLASCPVYLFDARARVKLAPASADDIHDYLRMGESYSRVFLYAASSVPRMLVIYR